MIVCICTLPTNDYFIDFILAKILHYSITHDQSLQNKILATHGLFQSGLVAEFMIEYEGRGFNPQPWQSFYLSPCGLIATARS